MRIKISAEAKFVVNDLADFVESKNTAGAGKRFRKRFLLKIRETLLAYSNHPLCKYPKFIERNLKCFFIGKWVVAYRKEKEDIIVYAIVYGTLLEY